jgi:hypothetical protein
MGFKAVRVLDMLIVFVLNVVRPKRRRAESYLKRHSVRPCSLIKVTARVLASVRFMLQYNRIKGIVKA